MIMTAPSAYRSNKNDIFANLLNPLGSSLHFGQPFGGQDNKQAASAISQIPAFVSAAASVNPSSHKNPH